MVDSRVRQVFLGGIVLEFLQIDIPSRLELAAAGTEGGKHRLQECRMRGVLIRTRLHVSLRMIRFGCRFFKRLPISR